jgi:transcriptional regulator with XRE-family HTH domain
MKLGDVLRKERERRKLVVEDVAAKLGLSVRDYEKLESGDSPVEEWGQKLAQIAIKLSTPTSRLISKTGKSARARERNGECGRLVAACRELRQVSREELAHMLDWPVDQISLIESGQSPLEVYAPLLLQFAELIDQPIFNLFYPCGLPLEKLNDYQ